MRKNWPHPVLDAFGSDYVNCAYQGAVTHVTVGSDLIVSLSHSCSSRGITQAVRDGDARYGARIICMGTMYRSVTTSAEPLMNVSIPLKHLNGGVEVTPIVIANRPFVLPNSELSPEFAGFVFDQKFGDILAEGESSVFQIYKEADELARLRSIFKIEKNQNPEVRTLESNLGGDHIVVLLPSQEYDLYYSLVGDPSASSIANTFLLMPVLTEALSALIGESESDYAESLMWKDVILAALEKLNLKLDENANVLQLADQLSSQQVFLSLRNLHDLATSSEV